MRKELVVKWAPYHTNFIQYDIPGAQIMFEEPKPLIKEVGALFSGTRFWKCPAVQAMCVNTFVVHCPMDMTLYVTKQGESDYAFTTPNVEQNLIDAFFVIRADGTLSLPPRYLMYCNEPLKLEVLPVMMLPQPDTNSMFIAGTFDIGKWVRPLELGVLPTDLSKPVVFRRGDPLFCLRFVAPEGTTIVFERATLTPKLHEVVAVCTGAKFLAERLPLKTLYTLAAPLLKLLRKNKEM